MALIVFQVINLQAKSQSTDPRYSIYRAAGEWLAENTPPDASVGALEVGIIGYYAKRSMIDFAGLIQPAVTDLMQTDTTYKDTTIWAVQNYRPQYLVLMASNRPRWLTEIASDCQLVERLKGEKYVFSRDVHIYHCQYN